MTESIRNKGALNFQTRLSDTPKSQNLLFKACEDVGAELGMLRDTARLPKGSLRSGVTMRSFGQDLGHSPNLWILGCRSLGGLVRSKTAGSIIGSSIGPIGTRTTQLRSLSSTLNSNPQTLSNANISNNIANHS